MYESYWGLSLAPFENTPDLRFFYQSPAHEEAYARLQYLVTERKGCGVLTGTYGCGKTTILRSLARNLGSEGNIFSVITNPRLDDLGLLRVILHNFKKSAVPENKADVLMDLEGFVQGVAEDGKHSVVIIDEAHAIESPRVFEELRLLLNMQTDDRFLLTLILAGQSELRPRVESNKQFNQRVTLRYDLGAFQFAETKAYIQHRLAVAGAAPEAAAAIFPEDVLQIVQKLSGGIPRWINQICHLSLLAGMGREARAVTPEIAQEAIRDIVGVK
jgi:type II secretory pathway predicted ATPase ExeA